MKAINYFLNKKNQYTFMGKRRSQCISCEKNYIRNYRLKHHVLCQHTPSLLPKDFSSSLPENTPLHFKMNGHKKNKRVNISVNDTSVKDKDLSKLNMCLFYYK
jgi:hypothetical protein